MNTHKLDASAIWLAALEQDNLHDYVSANIRERFTAFIQTFNEFGDVPADALDQANAQLQNLVSNRLKLERDWQQHPEILTEKIEQPFFVIGNARSGTTVAQCLLAEDDGHRAPKYWEAHHPSPPPGLDPESDAQTLARENAHVEDIIQAAPRILQIHPFLEVGGLADAECEDLYTTDFRIPHIIQLNKVSNTPQAIPPADGEGTFAFHKKLLQQFQWKIPTRRWVCKGPVHQYNIPALLATYPDAQCFWMHRRPEEYIISMLEMLEIVYRPTNGDQYRVDAQQLVTDLRNGFDYLLSQECIKDPRIHHINFHHFIKDPVNTLGQCYEAAGVEFSNSFQNRIRQWFENPANRSDRYGKLEYDANKYGLSKSTLRTMFNDYCERFGLYD